MLSTWLRKAADVTERVEIKAFASRGYAKSVIKVIAIMCIGAFIAGVALSSLISSPAALGSALALPFGYFVWAIYRRFS